MKTVAIATIAVIMFSGCFLAPMTDADDYTNPPIINMEVGDVFEYVPETNLPSVFSAEGTGMIGDANASLGAFLTFDGETLTGEATEVGDFTANIVAVWTCPEDSTITQITTQYIRFHITAEEDQELMTYGLTYANGWNLKTTPMTGTTVPVVSAAHSEESSDDIYLLIMVGCGLFAFGLSLGIIIAGRRN